jgi:cell division protein ZipA
LNLTIRDWMVIIGSLLILAVLVDAARRMHQERRSRVRVRLVDPEAGPEGRIDELDDPSLLRELPNGGARVLKREDLLAAQQRHANERGAAGTADRSAASQAQPGDAAPDARAGLRHRRHAGADPEADGGAGPAQDTPAGNNSERAKKSGGRAGKAGDGTGGAKRGAGDAAREPLAGVRGQREEPANLDWLEDLPEESAAVDSVDPEPGALPRSEETQVVMLHVQARDDAGFDGKAILEILLACDLRFGDMDFFHRHEQEAGRGPIQFSVANMLQPGVFDIDRMESMRTRGLLFFLTLPGPEDMLRAFEYMLETARTVARNLEGDVLDESRSVLTEQAVEHTRQQIRDFERRLRALRG